MSIRSGALNMKEEEHCDAKSMRSWSSPRAWNIHTSYGTRVFIMCLQEPTTAPYPEPGKKTPHSHTHCLEDQFTIIFPVLLFVAFSCIVCLQQWIQKIELLQAVLKGTLICTHWSNCCMYWVVPIFQVVTEVLLHFLISCVSLPFSPTSSSFVWLP